MKSVYKLNNEYIIINSDDIISISSDIYLKLIAKDRLDSFTISIEYNTGHIKQIKIFLNKYNYVRPTYNYFNGDRVLCYNMYEIKDKYKLESVYLGNGTYDYTISDKIKEEIILYNAQIEKSNDIIIEKIKRSIENFIKDLILDINQDNPVKSILKNINLKKNEFEL